MTHNVGKWEREDMVSAYISKCLSTHNSHWFKLLKSVNEQTSPTIHPFLGMGRRTQHTALQRLARYREERQGACLLMKH